jgi:hypothetical protein
MMRWTFPWDPLTPHGGAHTADHANQVGVGLLRVADLLRPGAHILDARHRPRS